MTLLYCETSIRAARPSRLDHGFSFLRFNRRHGSDVIAPRIRRHVERSPCNSSNRKEFGPSDKRVRGPGALRETTHRSRRPLRLGPELGSSRADPMTQFPPPPRGKLDRMRGVEDNRCAVACIWGIARKSLTSRPYPNVVPRSVSRTPDAPDSLSLATTLDMSQGAMRIGPF